MNSMTWNCFVIMLKITIFVEVTWYTFCQVCVTEAHLILLHPVWKVTSIMSFNTLRKKLIRYYFWMVPCCWYYPYSFWYLQWCNQKIKNGGPNKGPKNFQLHSSAIDCNMLRPCIAFNPRGGVWELNSNFQCLKISKFNTK